MKTFRINFYILIFLFATSGCRDSRLEHGKLEFLNIARSKYPKEEKEHKTVKRFGDNALKIYDDSILKLIKFLKASYDLGIINEVNLEVSSNYKGSEKFNNNVIGLLEYLHSKINNLEKTSGSTKKNKQQKIVRLIETWDTILNYGIYLKKFALDEIKNGKAKEFLEMKINKVRSDVLKNILFSLNLENTGAETHLEKATHSIYEGFSDICVGVSEINIDPIIESDADYTKSAAEVSDAEMIWLAIKKTAELNVIREKFRAAKAKIMGGINDISMIFLGEKFIFKSFLFNLNIPTLSQAQLAEMNISKLKKTSFLSNHSNERGEVIKNINLLVDSFNKTKLLTDDFINDLGKIIENL